MQTIAPAVDDRRADAELIAACRVGDTGAFEVLYSRHAAAVQSVARRHVRNVSDAEDLTSEAFAKVFELLKHGEGPHSFFRAYVCTTVSRLAFAQNDKAAKTALTDEPELFEDPSDRYVDPVMSKFESGVVSRAFRSLPERWQAVLWYSTIDEMAPAAIAPLLGLTPNGVSALLVRAREGLRNAYVQEHVHLVEGDECAPVASMLGAYVRDGLSARNRAKVSSHLESCERCAGLIGQLEDVGSSMRAVVLPLYIGVAASFAPLVGVGVTGAAAGSGAVLTQLPWWKALPRPALVAAAGTGVIAAAGAAVLMTSANQPGAARPSAESRASGAVGGSSSTGAGAPAASGGSNAAGGSAAGSAGSAGASGSSGSSNSSGAQAGPAPAAAGSGGASAPQAAPQAPASSSQGAPQAAQWSLPAQLTQDSQPGEGAPAALVVPRPSAPVQSTGGHQNSGGSGWGWGRGTLRPRPSAPASPSAPSPAPSPSSSASPAPSPSGPVKPTPSPASPSSPGPKSSESTGTAPAAPAPSESAPVAPSAPAVPPASASAPESPAPSETAPALPSGASSTPAQPSGTTTTAARPTESNRRPPSTTNSGSRPAPHWDPSRGWLRPSGGSGTTR